MRFFKAFAASAKANQNPPGVIYKNMVFFNPTYFEKVYDLGIEAARPYIFNFETMIGTFGQISLWSHPDFASTNPKYKDQEYPNTVSLNNEQCKSIYNMINCYDFEPYIKQVDEEYNI